MDRTILAIIIQEGSNFLSQYLKSRPRNQRTSPEPPLPTTTLEPAEATEEAESKATSIKSGCLPCSINHFSTCTGLLNEAMRFAKKEGIASNEVISRVNICMDELNALERVDLRPEMMVNLPPWEKELANKALDESRQIRHSLESLTSVDYLERVAADTQTVRQDISKTWFKQKLTKMPNEEKVKL